MCRESLADSPYILSGTMSHSPSISQRRLLSRTILHCDWHA